METSTLGAFLLLALALYGTPGPATLSLAASGAAFGLRRSMPYVLGILAGLAINVLLVAGGLGTLLTVHPGARRAFQVVSLVFLLYLAWKLATAEPASKSAKPTEGRRFTALEGLVLNVANPKVLHRRDRGVGTLSRSGARGGLPVGSDTRLAGRDSGRGGSGECRVGDRRGVLGAGLLLSPGVPDPQRDLGRSASAQCGGGDLRALAATTETRRRGRDREAR